MTISQQQIENIKLLIQNEDIKIVQQGLELLDIEVGVVPQVGIGQNLELILIQVYIN